MAGKGDRLNGSRYMLLMFQTPAMVAGYIPRKQAINS